MKSIIQTGRLIIVQTQPRKSLVSKHDAFSLSTSHALVDRVLDVIIVMFIDCDNCGGKRRGVWTLQCVEGLGSARHSHWPSGLITSSRQWAMEFASDDVTQAKHVVDVTSKNLCCKIECIRGIVCLHDVQLCRFNDVIGFCSDCMCGSTSTQRRASVPGKINCNFDALCWTYSAELCSSD